MVALYRCANVLFFNSNPSGVRCFLPAAFSERTFFSAHFSNSTMTKTILTNRLLLITI